MARARNIKPSFFTNEELVGLPFETRLLFIGLWTIADRDGRLEDRPKRIKMAVFPADSVDVNDCLNQLQASGFILRYEHDASLYIQILAFNKHQHPHKDEKASTIPAPYKPGASTMQAPCKNDTNPALTFNPITLTFNPITDTPEPEEKRVVSVEGKYAKTLRELKVTVQSSNPTLLAWIADGYTLENLIEAVEVARLTKPLPDPIPANYLDSVLRKPPPARRKPPLENFNDKDYGKGIQDL